MRADNPSGRKAGRSGPLDVAAHECVAAARLHPAVYDYFAGGADEEHSLHDAIDAWRRWRLWPHVLQDVTSVSTRVEVLGSALAGPLAVAPMGYQRLLHPDGEVAVARAAAAAGVAMGLATYATTSLEEVAAAADGVRWFQCYVLRDRGITADMLVRARTAGYTAVLLTADAPRVGGRRRDARHGYWLPMAGVQLSNFPATSRQPTATYSTDLETALTPDVVTWVAQTSGLPVVVKGVLRGDDARRCADAGAAGVVVSNHGGRQLDGAVASAEALPSVVEAVAGAAQVLVDGGIRSGQDVLRALALGADAVLVGRPVAWALAADGEQGVARLLTQLVDELAQAMALCGVRDAREVPRDLVSRVAT